MGWSVCLIKWKLRLWKAVSLDHEGNPDISMSCILLQTIRSGFADLQKVIQQGSSRPWHYIIISWWDHHSEDGTAVPLRCSSGTENYDWNCFQISMTADHCSNCERCRMIMQMLHSGNKLFHEYPMISGISAQTLANSPPSVQLLADFCPQKVHTPSPQATSV